MKTLSSLFGVFVLLLFGTGQASAAKLDTPWSGSGTSAVALTSNGTTADPRLDWSAPGASSGNWTFQAVAATTRAVPVQWEAGGFFGFFHVNLRLERFVTRGGADVLREVLQQPAQTDCCDPPSGGFGYSGFSTFNVQAGDVYGLKITGSHQTGSPSMNGWLALHEVDATAPLVTPVVTGTQAQGGYYAGTVSVKWTVQEDDSRITAQSGCGDATVTEDTAGKTFTCSVTSRGGTTAKSVTIKRDAGAPTLTVPTVVVKPAEAADGATVTFDASATDAIDPSPSVDCLPGSGSRFAQGTTTVTCTAKDAAGNATTKSFDVIVLPFVAPAPPASTAPAAPIVAASTPTVLPQKLSAVLSFRFTLDLEDHEARRVEGQGHPCPIHGRRHLPRRRLPEEAQGQGRRADEQGHEPEPRGAGQDRTQERHHDHRQGFERRLDHLRQVAGGTQGQGAGREDRMPSGRSGQAGRLLSALRSAGGYRPPVAHRSSRGAADIRP